MNSFLLKKHYLTQHEKMVEHKLHLQQSINVVRCHVDCHVFISPGLTRLLLNNFDLGL